MSSRPLSSRPLVQLTLARIREFIREPINDIGPSVNFAYSNVYGPRKNIGVLLNATYHSQPGGDTAARVCRMLLSEGDVHGIPV